MSLCAKSANVELGSRVVLQGFNFCVQPGEFVGVVGANGAGKSTALRLLAGLLPARQGRVTLDDKPLRDVPRQMLGREIAYLPQDRTIHWGLSVARVVALGRLPHKGFASAMSTRDEQAIAKAMADMDVLHLQHRSVAQLSGGERARVLLARALAQEARYLLADEPSAGLDPAHVLSLFEDLKRLVSDGKAVVTALHDLAVAARYATRVLLFKDGRCIADGPSDEVLSRANLAKAFNIDATLSHVDGLPVFLPRSYLRGSGDMT
jgi:iron complex transport system ATP-binding protein